MTARRDFEDEADQFKKILAPPNDRKEDDHFKAVVRQALQIIVDWMKKIEGEYEALRLLYYNYNRVIDHDLGHRIEVLELAQRDMEQQLEHLERELVEIREALVD
jgi:hypothetical protein